MANPNLTLDAANMALITNILKGRAAGTYDMVKNASNPAFRKMMAQHNDDNRWWKIRTRDINIAKFEAKLHKLALKAAQNEMDQLLAAAESRSGSFNSLADIDKAVARIDEMLGVAGKSYNDLSSRSFIGAVTARFSGEIPATRAIKNAQVKLAMNMVDKSVSEMKSAYASGGLRAAEGKIKNVDTLLAYPDGVRSIYSSACKAKKKEVNAAVADIYVDALAKERTVPGAEKILDRLSEKRFTQTFDKADKQVVEHARTMIKQESFKVVRDEFAKIANTNASVFPDENKLRDSLRSLSKIKGSLSWGERSELKQGIKDLKLYMQGKEVKGVYIDTATARAQAAAAPAAGPGRMSRMMTSAGNGIEHALQAAENIAIATKDGLKQVGTAIMTRTIDIISGAARSLSQNINPAPGRP